MLLDALDKSLVGQGGASVVDGLYQGMLVDYIACKECPFRRERRDKFLDVSVDISSSSSLDT